MECSTTDSVEVTFANTLEDIVENSIKLYPNPSETFFILEVGNDFLNGTVELINAEGKVIYNIYVTTNSTEIIVADIASGLYHIRISCDGKTFFQAVVIN